MGGEIAIRCKAYPLEERPEFIKNYLVYPAKSQRNMGEKGILADKKFYVPLIFDTYNIKDFIFDDAAQIVINSNQATMDNLCMLCKKKMVCRLTDKRECKSCDPKEINVHPVPFKGKYSEIKDLVHLSYALQINTRKIVFFANDHEKSHWKHITFTQDNGKIRELYVPENGLKKIQRRINMCILDQEQAKLPKEITGFIKERNILNNAEKHCGKKIIINVDIKDFFYSIPFGRVFHLFNKKLGFNKKTSFILTKLCIYSEGKELIDTGKKKKRKKLKYMNTLVPPGAPTSPAISNLICERMDSQLMEMSKKLGMTYTRYADDLTFSTDREINPVRIIEYIKHIVEKNGFKLNDDKSRIMRSGRRQEVTGVVVNKHPNMARRKYLLLRSEVHHIAEKTPQEQKRIKGKLAFLNMINPSKASKLKLQMRKILKGAKNAGN